MGHNPSRNPFRLARNTPAASVVDESYVAPSRWRAFRQMDATTRARYFNADELAWLKRYGTRLDRLATLAIEPRTEREKHFVRVCLGHDEPTSDRERLWLLMQVVCRFEEAADRAARTDTLEHEAIALRAFAVKSKAKIDHLEAYVVRLASELRHATSPRPPSICNVQYATWRFLCPELMGPPSMRPLVSVAHRGAPAQTPNIAQ